MKLLPHEILIKAKITVPVLREKEANINFMFRRSERKFNLFQALFDFEGK